MNDNAHMIETVRVIRGVPVDPETPLWPATIFDLRSRRLRYQMVEKRYLEPLQVCRDSAKFRAVWCPNAGPNGRWQLVEQIEGAE